MTKPTVHSDEEKDGEEEKSKKISQLLVDVV